LYETWLERFGVEIVDGIGSTEMLHIYLSNIPGRVRYGTTGWPVPGYEIELRGEDGQGVAEGEPGDAWVRGSNVERTDLRCAEVAAVLAGYLRTLGWEARGHLAGDTALDLPALREGPIALVGFGARSGKLTTMELDQLVPVQPAHLAPKA
jgi:acyl-coenzyme A synthetase/AMP-(fatty) acid ligase